LKKNADIKKYYNIPKWAIVGVLIFTALIYTRSLFNGFANLDDNEYILNNPLIKDFSIKNIKVLFITFYSRNYHPFVILTYLFEYTCFGANPLPYHIINVLLHIGNIWFVFKLCELLSGKKITAIIVSLLFAIHPMHVESVAWIAGRKDMLYSMFYLLSLIVYLRYIEAGYRRKLYIGVLLLFTASLFSKSAAVTLPVLLIAIDIYKGRKINIESLLEKVPFFLLSLFFGILALLSQQALESINALSLQYNFVDRIFLFTYTIAFYIIKLIAPFSLSAMHYLPDTSGGALPWQYYASSPFLLLITFLAIKRNFFRKEIVFGLFFFLITISVTLQIVHVGFAITAERYTYVSYIGLFYIAGQFISYIWENKERLKNIIIAIFLLFAIMLSFLTWKRIGVWKDGVVLFTDVVKKNPDSYLAYWMRGNFKRDNGDLQGASNDYDKSLEYNSYYDPCVINREKVRIKLNYYKEELQNVEHILSADSTIAEAYNNRGIIKAKTGDLNEALNDINMAIKLNPVNAEAYCNRGNIKIMQKDYKGSVEDFDSSLKIQPNNNIVYYNRGISRFFLKDTAGACEDWKRAMQLGYDASLMLRQYCN